MSSSCKFEGCAVDETGVCALERDPATCDHRIKATNEDTLGRTDAPAVAADSAGLGAPVLERPGEAAAFTSSQTLSPDVVSKMMASRYVTVVGILGDPNSGKTACLASTYLLVANAMLKGWTFADSRSLMGFEDLARGARDWNRGAPPDQMTMHTEMADDRRAGFLHLRLVRQSDGRRVDLALPDLPGEWTTKLVASAQSDRLDFLKAADVIWIVLDGRVLANKAQRQALVTRVAQLGGRLKTMLGDCLPRAIVVVTHRDVCEVEKTMLDRLLAELQRKEIMATIAQVAPFSENDAVRAGFGISDLVDATVGPTQPTPTFWPDSTPRESSRSFMRYRRDR